MVTFVSSPLGNGCWEGSSERRVPSKIEYDLPRKSSPKFLENRVCRGEPKDGRKELAYGAMKPDGIVCGL